MVSAAPSVSDYLIQDVCVATDGSLLADDPWDGCPAGAVARDLRVGEPLPYHRHDQPGPGHQGIESTTVHRVPPQAETGLGPAVFPEVLADHSRFRCRPRVGTNGPTTVPPAQDLRRAPTPPHSSRPGADPP